MHHGRSTAMNRFFQLLGFVVVSAALASPMAHANERKKAPAKKQVASATAKKSAGPRKAAVAAKPVRVSAKTSRAATRVAFVPARPSFGQLAGLHEVSRRVAREPAVKRTVISSWTALVAYVRVALQHEPREQFRVLYLDKKNQLILDEILNRGTVDHAPVYPREVVRRALEVSASAIILVHNHPSGDPTPSRPDIQMTKQIVEAARSLGVEVHDHLIVGREGVSSFRQLGLM